MKNGNLKKFKVDKDNQIHNNLDNIYLLLNMLKEMILILYI